MVVTTCLLLLFAGIVRSQPIRSNPDVFPAPAAWSLNIGTQLESSLASPIAEVRHLALQQVTYFGHFHPELDLQATTPALVRIYREDPREQNRIAAVSALHAVADEAGMQQLGRHLIPQPERVQLAVIGALADHYGTETFEGAVDMARVAEKIRSYFVAREGADMLTSNQ